MRNIVLLVVVPVITDYLISDHDDLITSKKGHFPPFSKVITVVSGRVDSVLPVVLQYVP